MYYFIFPFIYKKINNKFYYFNQRKNVLVESVLHPYRFKTKMGLSIFMEYTNYDYFNFIERNKPILNEYFEYFIKENTNG